MKEIYNNYKKELSNKNILYVIVFIVFLLGIIFGSLYIIILKDDSKKLILDSVKSYFENSNNISFQSQMKIFKTTLVNNLTFFISMWLLGISVIGLIIVLIMTFFKSFTLGFSIAGIFAKYNSKGIIGIFMYLFPSHIITSILTLILAYYSINLSIKLFRHAFMKKQFNFGLFMGKYFFLLMIIILSSIFCSVFDAFISPHLIKIFTKLIK